MKKLTNKELQIMQVFWNSEIPLSARNVIQIDPSMSQNTVQTLVRKLLLNDFLKVATVDYSGTVLARKYLPLISEKEYFLSVFPISKIKQFINAFIDTTDNKKDLENIKKRVESKIEKFNSSGNN
ncbi:BlaI/MecI/CopY family transcriptional regulator [Bombilactobacillus bombi]|uniref:BlaI/MecI/CopY family transcriptional regulator n=1 Tax=Bombilactobacillus bombi TaxID=1303590 RepID=UPI0038F64C12